MGKGKKKGGKGRGAAAEGGGDTAIGQSKEPEAQPSSSKGGDTLQQKVGEEKSKTQPKPGKSGDGRQLSQSSRSETPLRSERPRGQPEQQYAQVPPGFHLQQSAQRPPGFTQQQHPQAAPVVQQTHSVSQQPPQHQHPSGTGQPWGPPQRQQYAQQSPGFEQFIGPPQQQQYRPPGIQQGQSPQHYQSRGRSQQHQYHQRPPGFQQGMGLPQPYQQQPQVGQTQQYAQQPQGLPPQKQFRSKPQQQFAKGVRKPSDNESQKSQRPEGKKDSPKHEGSQYISQKSVSGEGGPDQSVEKFTPRAIVSLQEQMSQMSMINKTSLKTGTKGRRIPIETNYLNLDLGKLTIAYHYDVDIVPDTPKKFLRGVVEEFRKKHFDRYHPAFDGRKNLYSPYVLVNEGEEITDEIQIMDGTSGREKNFKVKVQFANTVDLTPLRNIRMTTLSPQEAIQCVEIVLRSAPSSRCIQAGRSFFTRPEQIIDLGEGMEMYQGFYQSVVRGWKPLLNVDVAHKAFPKEIDLVALTIELCSSYYQQLNDNDLKSHCLSDDHRRTLEKFLKTLRVVYEIRGQPGSKREYRVNGIKDCPRRYKFRPDNGEEMTIEDYFARKKNYRLQYPLMPTIWVGNMQRPDPILLPAELCTLVPGQAVNRKMTENQTSAMIKRAATSTDVRKDKIMYSLQQTKHNDDLCIKEFGFRIGGGFEQIQARVLEPPSLEYSNGAPVQPSKGVWRADNVRFLKGAEIKSWTIISACGPMDNMARLADMIYSFGPKCGMSLLNKAEPPFEVIRGRARTPRFEEILPYLQKCSQKKYDLVFVIIPDSGQTYSDVKRAAELNIGCLTQCIKRTTLFKKLNPATVNNILLKVNSKLNGTNHCLRVRPQILSVPCMIMGADVTHPSPDSQHIPSVAAVTASHDPKAFCYNICCRLQSPKTEIITDLQAITKEHLMYFHNVNKGQKPQRIIFFRDGVSEGQFNEVLAEEVRAIRNACTSLQNDYKPKITFLVVQKRHHTRFFPKNKRDSEDRNCNVPAGTCVDTDITNPNLQDFYLVSHASIQGVAKPTKYCTLWDDNDMSHDEIEALTYHLCHLFTRCNRSVSYPAPTYYAHLAAARAKVYIEPFSLDLNRLDNEQKRINILDIIRKQKPMFFV